VELVSGRANPSIAAVVSPLIVWERRSTVMTDIYAADPVHRGGPLRVNDVVGDARLRRAAAAGLAGLIQAAIRRSSSSGLRNPQRHAVAQAKSTMAGVGRARRRYGGDAGSADGNRRL
jgi:hypothetical protein